MPTSANTAPRRPRGSDDGHLDDLYLALACADGSAEAIEIFEETTMVRAKAAVCRIDRRPEFVDEVLQRLRERLLVGDAAKIRRYRGQGSLIAWVTVAAVRVALNLRKSNARPVHGDEDLSTFVAAADTRTSSSRPSKRAS